MTTSKGNIVAIIVALIGAIASVTGAYISSNKGIQASDAAEQAESSAQTVSTLIPVGTIIASILDPIEFAKQMNDSDNFDYRNSRWTLANGSNVPGTDYARIVQSTQLPDLRGLFLRGINNGRTDEYADPDGERNPGNLQPDLLKSHNHIIGLSYEGSAQHSNVRNDYALLSKKARDLTQSNDSKASETRPNNAAVYYYIKINN